MAIARGQGVLWLKSVVLTVFLCVGMGLLQGARSQNSPQPLPLEMRVPFDPTALPIDGRTILAYELHLTNFTGNPLTLSRIEVLSVEAAALRLIAVGRST
jgi:hypothetical protein